MPVFVFTDIEGSTRLWEEHTGGMGAVIARHDAILQEQVSASGGRITKHTGDGITAAYSWEFFIIWHINVHAGEIYALKGCQGLKGYPW
jgi:hypothetical protein